jgi:hypothetical protein
MNIALAVALSIIPFTLMAIAICEAMSKRPDYTKELERLLKGMNEEDYKKLKFDQSTRSFVGQWPKGDK